MKNFTKKTLLIPKTFETYKKIYFLLAPEA